MEIKCINCKENNLVLSKDIDYKQCVNCKNLIKLDNKYSKFDEIIKKNIGLGLFNEDEK